MRNYPQQKQHKFEIILYLCFFTNDYKPAIWEVAMKNNRNQDEWNTS